MSSEAVEKYMVLLLGVRDRPMPTQWHLQKEMFLLSKAVPKVSEFFDFKKHYNGPFSPALKEILEEPLYYDGAYKIHRDKTIGLTKHGREVFNKIVAENQDKNGQKFASLLKTISLVRDVYDRLEKDELLFLVYQTYPEHIEASNIYDQMVADVKRRTRLAKSMRDKGLITDERYGELMEIGQQSK